MQGGKEALHIRAVLSKEGKTPTINSKGTDPQGKPFSNVTVYEEQ